MSEYLDSVRRVFTIFWSLGRRARRTKFFFLFSFLPVVVAFIIRFNQIFSGGQPHDGLYLFTNIIMFFYLQMIVLVLALFYGTSVCSEEVEGRTLCYLTTRPVPKSAVVLGKYAAYTLLTFFMVGLGLVFSFIILNVDRLFDPARALVLLRYGAVLTFGLVAYGAFFVLLGSTLKRSIFFGLLFSFGWENVIQYFPGSTQRLAIVHYLKSFLPSPPAGRFAFLTFRLEPTRPGLAVLILGLITAGCLVLAGLVFSRKEYIVED
jgi:ABC-type transport system involved in multi-copper enzyme maturation permease subunit